MAEVFRRPSLTGIEVLWRWVFWGVVLAKPARWLLAAGDQVVRSFQTGGFEGLGQSLVLVSAQVWFSLAHDFYLCLGALLLWLLVSAAGRALVLRRTNAGLKPSFGAMLVFSAARWSSWAITVALWAAAILAALRYFVFGPQAQGDEPAWVAFCGCAIFGTLIVFVLWLGSSWVFSLATLYAAQGMAPGKSLRAALRRDALGGKLAEINLVLGIVKLALIVLAMVFSACPLPFETVETQSFLVTWTAGVLVVYFVASDYFHVVRTVAFLRMTDALNELPTGAAASVSASAS